MVDRWLASILFGLVTIWTGLWRGIEAQAYKPNALWFCMAMGITAITGGFLYRTGRTRTGTIASLTSTFIVLAFYLTEFITKPDGNATFRVAIAIVAAITAIVAILLPANADARPTR